MELSDFFISIRNIDKNQLYREIAGEYFGAFTSDNVMLFGNKDAEIKKRINWESFKVVSVYPRHLRIYLLIFVSSHLFRDYMWIEKQIKQIKQLRKVLKLK